MRVCFKRVVKAGIGSSAHSVWLSYEMELPFAPPVGMEVCEGDWQSIVHDLAYSDGVVFAFEEESVSGLASQAEVDTAVAEAIADGWKVSGGVLTV